MKWQFGVVAGVVLCLSLTARAVVLHPGASSGFSRPVDGVVGQWASSSAVAIAPHHFLATKHQGGSVGGTADFGGTTYAVTDSTGIGNADLRVLRINGTFSSYSPILEDELSAITDTVIGGFGRTRGSDLADGQGTYGYNWSASPSAAVLWGQNEIDAAADDVADNAGRSSDVYVADFDGPNDSDARPAEASLAASDSGGGWFVFDQSQWKVAGITRGVEYGEDEVAIFDARPSQGYDNKQRLDAVRLSSYAAQINAAIPEPGTAALLAVGGILILSRRGRAANDEARNTNDE